MVLLERPWIIINGIPNPFWRVFQKNIAEFIKANRLKPDIVATKAEKIVDEDALLEWVKILKGRFGGDRGPHFHFNGDVYHLSDEQWNMFLKPIMEKMTAKLVQAKTVPFEKVMELTETINSFQRL